MENYACDSEGSFINVASDAVDEMLLPEYLASSNVVEPKYLVHARECRLVKNSYDTYLLKNKLLH